MAERKHLFGTTEKSDFILNMTDAGTKKFCAMYCIIAMIFIELAAIPYYLTKKVVDYEEKAGNITFSHYVSDKIIYWAAVVMLGFGLLGLSIFLIGRMKKQIILADNKPLILLLGVIVMSFVSALASDDIGSAMTGYLDRAEGMLTLLGYYGFFAAAFTVVSDMWRKRVCSVIVGIGVVNSVIGFLQIIPALKDTVPNWFSMLNVTLTSGYDEPAANGLAMTPHALAALLTVAVAVAFNAVMFSDKLKYRLLYAGAAVIMTAAGVFTRTLTALIGIGSAVLFSVIVAAVYAAKGGKNTSEADGEDDTEKESVTSAVSGRSVIAAMLGTVIALGATVGIVLASQASAYPESDGYKTFYDEEVIRTDSIRVLMLLRKEDEDTWVYPYLWDDGLYIAEQHMFLGTGPDNWVTINREGATIDRTYNEYIDTAMQRGFVTLALYIAFLLVTLFKGIKAVAAFIRGEVGWAAPAVFCGVFAYMVQAFFNISALTNTPFFYICVGLIWSYTAKKKSRASGK